MDKVLQMIGMAKRAGKIVTGGFLSEKAVKSRESSLIIIASDISDESRKAIVYSCKYYNVDYIEYADKEQLGKITGGGVRAVVSVNDRGFAAAVLKKYSAQE
jgi:ribosomal protein L7Ae-like RNA K-turn-binding protein